MQFERSFDYPLLGAFLRNPKLYPFISADGAPAIEDVEAVEHPDIWYILASEEGAPFGFWMFAPDNGNPVTWTFHTVMSLDGRALTAMKELLGQGGWLWKHTPCLRAVTNVSAVNRIAHRFGLRAGLTVYGINPRSYMKNGALQDQILMGISKDTG